MCAHNMMNFDHVCFVYYLLKSYVAYMYAVIHLNRYRI